MLTVGTKIIDLECKVWGLIWRVSNNGRRDRYQIRWCDGSVTRGLHDAIIEQIDSGYLIADE